MHVFAQAFTLPKSGHTTAEYEDAYWPCKPQNAVDVTCYHCAIADGATETSFSRVWANQLVRSVCRKRLLHPESLTTYLPHLQRHWSQLLQRRLRQKPLPWYVEEKVRNGAAASLLGFHLIHEWSNGNEVRQWQAIAVGDCYLVQMRKDEILAQFPITESAGFTSRPYLISSIPTHNERLLQHVVETNGDWNVDDEFYLMTDALAHWFTKSVEQGEKPWAFLRDIDTREQQATFGEWIAGLRSSGEMRNDDVTLFRINLP